MEGATTREPSAAVPEAAIVIVTERLALCRERSRREAHGLVIVRSNASTLYCTASMLLTILE
jgi:hypothetical protein